jgi:phage gpG-like protein
MAEGFHFEKINAKAKIAVKVAITEIGQNSKQFFRSNFDREGFTDAAFEKWKPRKAKGKRAERHKILNKSGALKNSIGIWLTSTSSLEVVISSNLVYSAIHNEGLAGSAWGSPFVMSKRQFIGDSVKLDAQNMRIIERKIDNIFR